MIKLSIIIPVYNVEKYLDECVQSLISQGIEECELVLVDDGSTDKSGKICDSYHEKYKEKVQVIHKNNGGLSSARNAGLDIAKGAYIAFVDSDDRISKGAIQAILEWVRTSPTDICFMQAIKFFEDGNVQPLGDCIKRDELKGKTKSEAIYYLSTRPKYPGSACTKLYSRSFLETKQIRFPKDRRTSEDLGYILDCIMLADTYDALEMPYYEYRQGRKDSLTHSNTLKGFWDHALFITDSKEKLSSQSLKTEQCRPLFSFVAYEYAMMVYMYARLNKKDKKEELKFLKENQDIMKYAQTKKLKTIQIMVRLIGIKNTSTLLNIYMRHR